MWQDHRRIINGILWRLRTGAPWRDLPARYGPWQPVYDRFVRWQRDGYEPALIESVRATLRQQKRTFREIRYGFYREDDFRAALAECRTMIFLCEHETQGIAYQQALSCNVPILAWDRRGHWRDPSYYPDKVTFGPVTSVPYWDDRCGRTFESAEEFGFQWLGFWEEYRCGRFKPRDYILETLTLERSARRYLEFVHALQPKSSMLERDACG